MSAKQPITAEDLYAIELVEDPQLSPDGRRLAFVKVTLDRLANAYRRHIWLADLSDDRVRPRQFTFGPKSDTAPRWSPDGATLAFVSERSGKPQLFAIEMAGGEARPLTEMPNGAAHPVWSPDGRRLAFLARVNAEERRREEAARTQRPPTTALEAKHRAEVSADLEQRKKDPRVVTRLPYRTGTEYLDDRTAHIYVVDVGSDRPGQPRRLTEGDASFDHIAWTADGQSILTTLSRTPKHSPWEHIDVVRVRVTGRRRTLRRLTRAGHDHFRPQASPDGQWVAMLRQAETGSFGRTVHLAVMAADGRGARDLTLSLDRSVEAFQWSPDGRHLYFQAGDRGDTGLYRVGVNGGRVQRVVGGRRMVLGFSLARAGRVAFAASTPVRPADLYLRQAGRVRRLTDFNAKLLRSRQIARTTEVRFRAPDGYGLQGWLLKPTSLRAGRRVPLAVNVHGGPHIMWGPSMPSMWLEWQLHAARGYAVFYCNPRGAEGYGEAHAAAIQSGWGEVAMGDVLSGVDAVVAKGFVDAQRLALTGGSYAGYLTAWIVGHDQRFACAWAQRGLYNLVSWYGTTDIPWLIEREFDLFPYDDVAKSWQHSPLAYVRQIRTPLAIEHQDQDYRCPVSDAEQLFAALQRLKRPVVFYRYPREGHEMSRSGEPHHRVDRLKRMTAWFDKYCQRRTRKRD